MFLPSPQRQEPIKGRLAEWMIFAHVGVDAICYKIQKKNKKEITQHPANVYTIAKGRVLVLNHSRITKYPVAAIKFLNIKS